MKYVRGLECLADPKKYHDPIDIDGFSKADLLIMMRSIMEIRLAEYKLATGRRDGLIGGPVHLGVGQEAIPVGVTRSLNNQDHVFGAHRSHGHLMALNPNFYKLFCEVLGRDDGFSRGMGGSMHLWDGASGFSGSVPIVAGTVSLALGAALAAKLGGRSSVAVAYLGDGAMEEGVVHESLNFARVHRLPILFVVENNLFASHMHASLRQPTDACCRFAEANLIEHELLDGNDVCKVASVAANAIDKCRSGDGPFFIEAVTYRWFGHVDWREDVDVGVSRSKDDIAHWRSRDPLRRLTTSMVGAGMIDPHQIIEIESMIKDEIDKHWESAMEADFPGSQELLGRVYAE